jgi:cytochrome c oxidase subunit 2
MLPLLAATQNTSMFDPASPPAEWIRSVAFLTLAVTGFIFVVVEAVLVYCLVRFRRGRALLTPNPSPPSGEGSNAGSSPPLGERGRGEGATEPPQVYGSKPIEIAWTVGPVLIVFVLVLVSARAIWEINADPPDPHTNNALFVTVVGRQWWWEYDYDYYDGKALGFITANELHVPAGDGNAARPVYLTLKSADVCHSFWVPRLAGKTDLIPGRTNYMWFQTSAPGLYVGQCAEFCGAQHANMLLRVVVEEPEKFQTWLDNQKGEALKPPDDDRQVQDGQAVLVKQTCVTCHRVRGVANQGTYAPDLTHLMSRDTLGSGMILNTDENLRKWVANPQQFKPGCLMAPFSLSDHDADDLVHYLETLK